MPDTPGNALAARFRSAMDRKLEEQRRREEHERRRLERRQAARRQLFSQLVAFGAEVGHLEVKHSDEVVVLRFEGRCLRFTAKGPDGDVDIDGDGLEGERTAFLQDDLDRWALRHTVRGRDEVGLLFDQGLESLLTAAFQVRADEPAAPPPPQVPGKGRSL